MDKVSYALGMSIGHQLQQMNATELNIDDFGQALRDVFAGKAALSEGDAQAAVQTFFDQKSEEKAKSAKADGEKFLAENAGKEGVVTLPSGLQYQVLREGNGRKPAATDQVECHYEGTLIDGQVFDAAKRPRSASIRSLQDGQKACSSCRKVPSIASSSPTRWAMESAAQASPSRHLPRSSSTWNSSKSSKSTAERP